MIVYQIIMYTFCRFPELVYSLQFYFILGVNDQTINSAYDLFCSQLSICYFVSNTVQYFYTISYLINFYFLLKFNKQFRAAFKDFFLKKFGKFV